MHQAEQSLFEQPLPPPRAPGVPSWRAVRYGELAIGEPYALEPGGRLYRRRLGAPLSATTLDRRVYVSEE